jgi:hypothetical protein
MPLSPIIGVSVTGTDQGGYGRVNFSGSSVTGSQNGDTYTIRLRDFNTPYQIGAQDLAGMDNRTSSVLSFVDATRVFTIAPVSSSFTFWTNNVLYTKTGSQTVTIPTTVQQNFIFFDSSGTLTQSAIPWEITSSLIAPVSTVYWDGNSGSYSDERHSAARDRELHKYLHNTRGAAYDTGLAGTFGNTSFSVAPGVIYDEDIRLNLTASYTSCRLWFRKAAGSEMTFRNNVTSSFAINTTGTQLQYDNAGVLTNVAGTNNYVINWVYATDDILYPIAVVVGTAEHANLTDARNAAQPAFPNLATREWKLIYSVIYQAAGGPKTPTFVESADYRAVGGAAGGVVNSLPATNVSFINTGTGITGTNVQTALVQLANSTGSGGVPGGSNTHVQFNDSGSFGGSSGLTFNKNTGVLSAQTASFSMMSASNAFISSTIYTDDTIDVKAPSGSNSAIIQFPSIRQYNSTGSFTNNTSGLAIYERFGADCANFLLIGSTVETGEPGKLGSMNGTFTYGEQYVTTNTGYRLRVLSAISGVTAGDIEFQLHAGPGQATEIISASGTEFRQHVTVTGTITAGINGGPSFITLDPAYNGSYARISADSNIILDTTSNTVEIGPRIPNASGSIGDYQSLRFRNNSGDGGGTYSFIELNSITANSGGGGALGVSDGNVEMIRVSAGTPLEYASDGVRNRISFGPFYNDQFGTSIDTSGTAWLGTWVNVPVGGDLADKFIFEITNSSGAFEFNHSGTTSFSATTSSLKSNVDIEITGSSANGLILSSPNGTRWRLTINNSGSVVATSL